MQHLDEGTVHAWLDGALSAEEAERVERHANECGDCAALVAEARGLVAGASRILSALDDVPAAVPFGLGGIRGAGGEAVPGHRVPRRPQPAAVGRRWWSRPAAMAAAAGLVLMAGSAIVLNRTGGRASLGASADTADRIDVPTREAEAPVVAPVSTRSLASEGAQAFSEDGRGAGADVAAPRPTPAPSRQSVSAAKKAEPRAAESRAATAPREAVANLQRRDSVVLLEQAVPTAAASTGAAVAQRAVTLEKAVPAPPPAAADVTADQRAQEAAPAPSVARRAGVARARSERSLPAAAAALERAGRVDTVYLKSQVDTIIVDRPDNNPRYRPEGGVVGAIRPFTATGCYQVLQGRVPRPITLTGDPVWSGAAEHGFVATAPGVRGYWSQPKTGDIHIVVDRWVVTARIDPSTGELRGTAQRGRTRETFRAKRGC